jgi:hypothetical protein
MESPRQVCALLDWDGAANDLPDKNDGTEDGIGDGSLDSETPYYYYLHNTNSNLLKF